MSEQLVYTAIELQRELRCGRATAQRLARELGVRISARRIVVPHSRLMAFLEGSDAMTNGTGDENRRRPGCEAQDGV